MTKTKTIQHEYGEKEIEVVECSSCGQEIAKEESYYFMIRNDKNKDGFTGKIDGRACEYCVDNPISFPVILGEFWNRVMKYKLEFILVSIFWFALGILAGVSIP